MFTIVRRTRRIREVSKRAGYETVPDENRYLKLDTLASEVQRIMGDGKRHDKDEVVDQENEIKKV